jgi:hypothetical protein
LQKWKEKLKIWNSRNHENFVFTFVSSCLPTSIFFVPSLVFAVNFGSGLSGLGNSEQRTGVFVENG